MGSNMVHIYIHWEFAIDMKTGEKKRGLYHPFEIRIGPKFKTNFYGNSLLTCEQKPYLITGKRVIQYNNTLFINATVEFFYNQISYTLVRDKGMLIITDKNRRSGY